MGSVINSAGECPHCGNNNLFSDYYYNTGETIELCNACGKNYQAFFKRGEDDNIVKQDVEYPIAGSLVIAVKSYRPDKSWYRGKIPYENLPEDGTVLWEIPITKEITMKDIYDFIGYKPENETDINPLFKDAYAFEYSHRNLFQKADGEYKQLWYIGDSFRFGIASDGKISFIMEKAVWDIHSSGGYGVIMMQEQSDEESESNKIHHEYFAEAISPEAALSIWNSHVSDKLDIETSCLTVWDENKNELICLKGTLPEAFNI